MVLVSTYGTNEMVVNNEYIIINGERRIFKYSKIVHNHY